MFLCPFGNTFYLISQRADFGRSWLGGEHERYLKTYMATADVKCPLTAREVECLSGLAEGLKYSEISKLLEISEPTVALHVSNARRKLGAATREQAVAIAVRNGWLK